MKWISIEDEKPTKNEVQFLFTDGKNIVLTRYNPEGWFKEFLNFPENGVTHWMPLPKLPSKND